MKTLETKIEMVRQLLSTVHGQFMTLTFTKKDGSERMMTCRLGVKKDLKGGANTVAHINKYLTVYDMVKHAYRNVNLETVTRIKAGGQEINFA